MSKIATFLFGLPCSGKTTWYKDNLLRFRSHTYVNADDIKFEFEDYDETVEGMYKEETIAEAKKRALDTLNTGRDLVMDAGSINSRYTMSIIQHAKDQGYNVHMIHLDTPYYVCLQRNKLRKRSVPEELILSKEVKRMYHWGKYKNSEVVDSTEVIPYFTEQHIFFDMDGVLAAQSSLPVINGKIDFVNSRYFRYLPVVKQVKNILYRLARQGKKIYILSAAPTSISLKEKKEWLKDNFSIIEKNNIFFVNSGQYKAEMFHDLATRLKLDPKDMCLVEDTHSIIREVRQGYNMHSLHVSELLTKYHNEDVIEKRAIN